MMKFDIYDKEFEFNEETASDLPIIIYGYFTHDEDDDSFDAFYISRSTPDLENFCKNLVELLNKEMITLGDISPLYN